MTIHNILKDHIQSWINIEANACIIEWITNGIMFHTQPRQFEINNRAFNTTELQVIDDEITKLVSVGAIKQVSEKPVCISAINLEPKKSGKHRLIVDLWEVNRCIQNQYFRNEGIETAAQYITYGDKFLGIAWKRKYFVWQVHPPFGLLSSSGYYPFGLSSSGYYPFGLLSSSGYYPFGLLSSSGYFFNKTIRSVTQYLREQGLHYVFRG